MTVVRFGPFELDTRAGELRQGGTRIVLPHQPLKVLMALLEHPGELVTREELRRAIWPTTEFGAFDEGLAAAVYKLRTALGDSGKQPRFIETLPRRGYRFIGALAAPEAPVRRRARWPAAAALAGLFAALLLELSVGGLRARHRDPGAPHRIQSLAVLPLVNLSGDSTQEYFADGMTEALTANLGRLAELRVISRTSAMHYKGTRDALPEIARQLGVDAVVEGSVVRAGQRVRITTQLIEASTDRHLWSATYERDFRDVLALQDEVVRAITNEVRLTLTAPEGRRASDARVVDPEAYDAYLRGRAAWNEWTDAGLRRSVVYFEQAIGKDSSYAPAWAGLSDAYQLLSLFGDLPPEVALPRAKAAALRAVALDETVSEAQVSLASVWLGEWDWVGSQRAVIRAIKLDPNNAMAHQWYGYLLAALSRFDSALAEMRQALALDPLSPNKMNSLGATFYRARRYDEALRYLAEVPDPDANSEVRHRRMAAIYERRGRLGESIAELRSSTTLAGKRDIGALLEREYRRSGFAAAKRAFLWADVRDMERRARQSYPRPLSSDIAADYAQLGEPDRAFAWLERALRAHDHTLMHLKVDDRFDAVRSDPRFAGVLRRLRFPS
jgi:TolB-like protein/DNA-binding winged helix-turn-helix (wHTH) protein